MCPHELLRHKAQSEQSEKMRFTDGEHLMDTPREGSKIVNHRQD